MTYQDPDPSLTARLIHRMVEGITDYAIYRLDRNGIVTSWNAGAERAKGYKKEEIIGRNFSTFFTSEDRKQGKPARALKSALLDGRFEDEGWRVRKDGSGFWASVVIQPIRDEDGEFTGFAEITRDLSEEHATYQALQESEQRHRLLVDSISSYAIYALDLRGHLTSWNSGGERAKGYKKNDVIGKSFSMFFTAEDQANGKPARILQITRDNGRFEEEAWRVRKDGTKFWANVIVEPIRDRGGDLIRYANVTRDITERNALERARTQLQYVQKMKKVGELSCGIAHHFNNPLTAVLGSLELIKSLNCDTRLDRYIKIAQQGAERGAKITHQLLAFSRKQTLQPVTTDLNHLISEFEDLFRVALGELFTFSLDLREQVLLVDIDQAQFMSALLNLVVNARDAMRKDGSLTIATGRVSIDAVVARDLNDLHPGSYVTVDVRDTGAGMSAETRSHAIEPFFTTKDVGQGAGLGLSQVYGLVKQSGGHMEIRSEIDRGTSVMLYLPVSLSEKLERDPAPYCMVAS